VSFLLDTDICSAYLKGNGPVTSRFIQYDGRLNISTITFAELLAWALRGKASPGRRLQVDGLLNDVRLLPADEVVARQFGAVRAWQLDRGLSTPDLDLLNASVALVNGLTLATHNTRDYANVIGLSLVDWLMP
jgi:tRNA(fMet)-specific endonuclease VapC